MSGPVGDFALAPGATLSHGRHEQGGKALNRCVRSRLVLALILIMVGSGCADAEAPTAEEGATTEMTLPCRMVESSEFDHETGAPGEGTPLAAIKRFVHESARYLSPGEPLQRPEGDWVWVASDGQVEAVFRLSQQPGTHIVNGFDKCAGFTGRRP